MSTSDLYVINRKSVAHLAEFRNGWGSAPILWDFLGSKYISERPVYSMEMGHMRKVWALADDDRLSPAEKIALMMTFDSAFIPLFYLREAAEACEEIGRSLPGDRVNHWPAFGAALRDAASMKHNRHARGVGLSCTSVSDMWSDATEDQIAKAWPIFVDEGSSEPAGTPTQGTGPEIPMKGDDA